MDITGKYINLFTDFGFKRIFGTDANKELLASFLNALLAGEEHIIDLKYLNPNQLGSQKYDRSAVYDIFCMNQQGDHFIVEMQNSSQRYFKDRSVFYAAFPIREQAVKGDKWDFKLKRVYAIGITNFNIDNSPDYYHRVMLMDVEKKTVFYDKLTFIYLELPKFSKMEPELRTLFDKWLYVMKNLGKFDDRPQVLSEDVFGRLFQEAEIALYSPEERLRYEHSLLNAWNTYSTLETALEDGYDEGYNDGFNNGFNNGVEQGEQKARLEMAKNLKKGGMSHEQIASATTLPLEIIQEL